MTKEVDQRVVEMRFDNKQFEQGVRTPMSTLDRLKEALRFKGASDGIDKVSASAKALSFSGAEKAVESLKLKFSALEVAAVTAIGKATSAGLNMAKSFMGEFSVIGNMRSGFEEYELKLNSIQTIMSNTRDQGVTMADVTAVLDELNTYADKTIYNFAEMTRNIGTFTAAGVDLNTSAKAIQGIANLAAMSGSNSQQASTAMYQLSQALAAGTVKLMDWNSVVNAGMGGQLFQNALKETAREFGIDVDAMIAKHGSFRESLQEGWITAEVMTTTLNKMTVDGARQYGQAMLESGRYTQEQVDALIASAQAAEDAATKVKTFTQLIDTLKEAMGSGWAKTWELIVGDFDEAKEFFTELSNLFGGAIDAGSDSRNSFVEQVMGGGGLATLSGIKSQLADAGISYEVFQERCIEAARTHGVAIDDMIAASGSFEATLKDGWLGSDIFSEAVSSMEGSCSGAEAVLAEYQRIVDEIWNGDWGNGEERMQRLTEAGYDYAAMQSLVESTIDGHRLSLEELSDEQLASIGLTEDQIAVLREMGDTWDETAAEMQKQSGREMLMEGILNVAHSLVDVFGAVKSAFSEVFPSNPEGVRGAIEGFRDLTERLRPTEEALGKIKTIFEGLFSVVKLVLMPFQAAFGLIAEKVGQLDGAGDGLLDFLAGAAQGVTDFVKMVEDAGGATGLVKGAWDAMAGAATAAQSFIGGLIDGSGLSELTLDGAVGSVKEFVDSLSFDTGIPLLDNLGPALELVQGLLSDASSKAKDLGESIGGFFSGIFQGSETPQIADIGSMFDKGAESAVSFSDRLKSAGDSLTGFLSGAADKVRGLVEGLGEGLGSIASGIGEGLGAIFGGIGDGLSKLNLGGIAGLLAGVGVGSAGLGAKNVSDSVSGFIKALTEPFEGFKKITDGVAGVLDRVKDSVKAYQTDLKADVLLKVAGAIAVLAASVWVLSTIYPESLVSATTAVVALLVGLATATKLLGGGTSLASAAKSLTLMAGMSASVLVLAAACKVLSTIEPTALLNSVLAVTAMMLALAKATSLSGGSGGGILKMVGLAASVLILAKACEELGSLDDRSLLKGVTATSALVLVVGAFNKLSEKSRGVSSGLGFLAIAGSMKLLLSSVRDLAAMSDDGLQRGMTALVGILAAVSLAMTLMAAMPKNMLGVGAGFGAMASGLLVMVGVIRLLAGLDPSVLTVGLVGLGATLATMAVGIAAVGVASKLLVGSTPALLAFGAAAALLGVGILAAGSGVAAFATGLAAIAGVLSVSGVAIVGFVSAIGLAIAGLVPVFATAFGQALVAVCEQIELGAPAIGSALVAVVLAAVTALGESATGIAEGLLVTVLAILDKLVEYGPQITDKLFDLLIQLVQKLGERSPELVSEFVAFFQELFASIGEAFDGIDVESLLEGLKMVALIDGILAALGVGALLSVPAMAGVLGIGLVATELTGVLAALGALNQIEGLDWSGGEGGELLKTLGDALGGFIGSFAGSAAEGFSDHMPAMATNLSGFMENLSGFLDGARGVDSSVTDGIGNLSAAIMMLVGSELATAVVTLLTAGSSFSDLGDELTAFSESVKPFVDSVSQYDASSFEGLGYLTGAIVNLSLAGLADAVSNVLGIFTGKSGLDTFGSDLSSLGEGLADFVEAVDGVQVTDGVTAAVEVAGSLAKLATSIPSTGGILQTLGGVKDLGEFGLQAAALGAGLMEFSVSVAGLVQSDGLTAAPAVGEALASLAKTIPPSGGILQKLGGEQDLGKFGTNAAEFGKGIKAFADEVTGITSSTGAEEAVKIGTALKDLAAEIPSTGGVVQLFAGEQDLGKFGEDAGTLGEGIKKFADSVSGISSSTDASNAASVAQSLSEVAGSLSESGGLAQFFSGEKSLANFGENIAAFGAAMKSFSDNVTDIDAGNMNGVVLATSSLATSLKTVKDAGIDASTGSGLESACGFVASGYNKLKVDADLWNSGTVDNVVANVEKLRGMVTGLSGLDTSGAESLKGAMTALSEIDLTSLDTSSLDGAFSAIDTAAGGQSDKLYDTGKSLTASLSKGLSSGYEGLKANVSSLVEAVLASVKEKDPSFRSSGTASMQSYAEGVGYGGSSIRSAISSTMWGCIAAINGFYSSFASSGGYLAQGLANGMSANTYLVTARAAAMANAAKVAANAALGVASPSKEFYATGRWSAIGIINAMDDYRSRVAAAGSALGTSALDGIRSTIADMASSNVGALDVQPTIRPVLDLSDVESGSSRVRGMLGGLNTAIGWSASKAGAVGSNRYYRNQNGSDEIVSAIRKLGATIEGLPRNTYNVGGVTYDDGSATARAVEELIRATVTEERA